LRVSPNNPDQRYLIQKLDGTAAAGGRMPLNGPPFLPQTTVDVIRQWITDGALPTQSPKLAPTVVSVAPGRGTAFDALPTTIQIIFSDNIDASVVSVTTVELIGSGGDGTFAEGNEFKVHPTNVGLSPMNSRLLVIDLSSVTSTPDHYQLRLAGSGATALASDTGLILDGDGDSLPGGDFVTTIGTDDPTSTGDVEIR
jgi:hypothetical protein